MEPRFYVSLFIIVGSVAFFSPSPLFGFEPDKSITGSERHARAVFERLLPIVYSCGKPVRLYYLGHCALEDSPVPFPRIKVKAPTKNKSGLAAVREIFEKDKNVTVAESRDGIIRIRIGNVPTEILRTKLSRLTLNEDAQYNPHKVFDVILKAAEFGATEDLLGFTEPVRLGGTLQGADARFPHLPRNLQSVTAEQVLDMVAKTWAGRIVVIYGVCDKPRRSDNGRMFVLRWGGQVDWPIGLAPSH